MSPLSNPTTNHHSNWHHRDSSSLDNTDLSSVDSTVYAPPLPVPSSVSPLLPRDSLQDGAVVEDLTTTTDDGQHFSFHRLLESGLVLHHITKYLDLPSNLQLSLASRRLYMVASSDRIWSRYIVKNATRSRCNWHVAWGAESFWWMKPGENRVISHDSKHDSQSLYHSIVSNLNLWREWQSLHSNTQESEQEEHDFSDEDEYETSELVHGYADYVPCLEKKSSSPFMNVKSCRTATKKVWKSVSNVVPSVVHTLDGKRSASDDSVSSAYDDSIEYTPEYSLQYWNHDFVAEDTKSDVELQSATKSVSSRKLTPEIPGHGVKQSYALFKKILRHEIEYRNFHQEMREKSEDIDKVVKYRIKPCVWTTLITYFCCVVFWTSITAPMLWDNIIPVHGLYWLIPYAGFGFFVPLFLIVVALEIFFSGWIPCISYLLKRYFTYSCERMYHLFQSSHVSWIYYLSYWWDPVHARDIESRFLAILALHILYLPTLILCIGVNQFFFNDQNVLSYVVIPTYVCFLGSFLDFTRRLFFGRKGRFCHVRVVYAFILFNITLIYLGIVLTIALAASKHDHHQWLENTSWSIVFIPFDCSMGFLIVNITLFRLYMIIRDAKYRYHQCMDWMRELLYMITIFVVTSLFFMGFLIACILFPLRMDGKVDVPYLLVASPIPISIGIVATCLSGLFCMACLGSIIAQLVRRTGEMDTDS